MTLYLKSSCLGLPTGSTDVYHYIQLEQVTIKESACGKFGLYYTGGQGPSFCQTQISAAIKGI
jgi:hypothetical protein